MKPKSDALDKKLAMIRKRFGDESATRLGKGNTAAAQITEVIPTGIEVVDRYLLGIGGLPVGRMSEVLGENACGKTTLSYQCIASCQRDGGHAIVLDAEWSFDEERARANGVDVDSLLVLQPKNAEMGLEQTKMLLNDHNPKTGPLLLVFDTIAAMMPDEELKREAGKRGTAPMPRLMSTELPKIVPLLAPHRAHLLALNQIRQNIGVMFGPDTMSPGGNAVKFYASWRLQFFGGKAIKDPKTNEHTGKILTMVVAKTRLTAPFRKARVRLDYATGWNNEWSTLEHAKTMKVIEARGKGTKGAKGHQLALAKLGWGVTITKDSADAGSEEE